MKKTIIMLFVSSIMVLSSEAKNWHPNEDVLSCNSNIVLNYIMILQLNREYLINDIDEGVLYNERDCILIKPEKKGSIDERIYRETI